MAIRNLEAMVRHVLVRRGWPGLVMRYLRLKGTHTAHLGLNRLADRFAYIYERGVWAQGPNAQSQSGRNSELACTGTVRQQLPDLLRELGTQRLLDIGCGDFHWMQLVPLEAHYIGVDLVPSLIQANRERFGGPRREFLLADATCEPLPPADTILCRDVLFHLSFADIARLLTNVRTLAQARYLVTTTDTAIRFNADIVSGDFRRINLCRRPFRFPTPERSIADDQLSSGRRLGAWPMHAIPVAACGRLSQTDRLEPRAPDLPDSNPRREPRV